MQGPALRIAAEMGLETVAADANSGALCVSLADAFVKVDLKNREGIESVARLLMNKGGIGGIMTAGTDFSATVAWAAEKLGLPGIPYETALDASDKERMRGRFKTAGILSPEFLILKKAPETGFNLPFPFPAVVKPVDNMGARGCRRVDNLAELDAAVTEALGFSLSGRVIVEEYMEGPEYSIDALVYKGEISLCGIADRHIFFPPYFIEMGHTMPSAANPRVLASIIETFCRGVKALDIDNGAAKGDIKLTPKGPMIGEIAARLSGGYMSGWTYPYSSGVLPTKGAIEIALGKKPGNTKSEWNWTCAERAFISIPGKVRSVTGIERAKVMPWVRDVFLRVKPGSVVSFPENNVTKCGNIISAAPGREDAVYSAENTARSILLRLQAPNEETETFLETFRAPGESPVFPPDAFPMGSDLFAALSALPEGVTGNSVIAEEPVLLPFPEFTESALRDYAGRDVTESLEAVRILTGLKLPFKSKTSVEEVPAKHPGETPSFLGRSFWQAFIRGGYQGAVYFIDSVWTGND